MINDTRIHELSKAELKEPVLIQGLPGLGYVGKVAVDYFIEKLKPKKFAELYSSYLLFPDGNLGINISEDGTYSLPKYEFYSFGEKEPNAIFLTGDAQPSVTGQYEVASTVLDFAQRFNSKMVLTMGGYGTRSGNDVGAVYAVVGDSVVGERLKKMGAKLAKGGAVTGAAGVILGIGRQRGLQCAGLLGSTTGVYPDLEAARAVIQMLTGLVGMPVELKDLDTEIEDMRKRMEKFRRTEGVVGTSSVLLGGKYLIAARALAERSAAIFKKMSLVSLNTTLSEGEALRVYSALLDKAKSP